MLVHCIRSRQTKQSWALEEPRRKYLSGKTALPGRSCSYHYVAIFVCCCIPTTKCFRPKVSSTARGWAATDQGEPEGSSSPSAVSGLQWRRSRDVRVARVPFALGVTTIARRSRLTPPSETSSSRSSSNASSPVSSRVDAAAQHLVAASIRS